MRHALYRIRILAAEVDGVSRLLFGEAVSVHDRAATPMLSRPLHIPLRQAIAIEGVICQADLDTIVHGLAQRQLQVAGHMITTGAMVERPAVVLSPAHTMRPDAGASLHPDSRYTYELTEWWDADEQTFRAVWATRTFADIGEAVEQETGLALHHLSDRLGNVLIFDRVSPWHLDYHPDHLTHQHWVRPLYGGPPPTPLPPLKLHVRIHSFQEVVVERVYDLAPGGIGIPLQQRYSAISLGLFDAATGELLASEHSDLLTGPITTREGHVERAPAPVTGTDNHARQIQWTIFRGALPGIHPGEPWTNRSRQRDLRNRILAESARAVVYQANSRQAALDYIRGLIRASVRQFVYIWDPYFDQDAAKDFLYEVPPHVSCRLLIGSHMSAAGLEDELRLLRSDPWLKQIECQHRVIPDPTRKPGWVDPAYHDRFLITADAAWVLGTSFNAIGKKPGMVVQLLDADRLRWLFEDEWNRTPVGWQVRQLC